MSSCISVVSYVIFSMCIALIHTRIIPLEHIVDTPVAIDTVSIDNNPLLSVSNRVAKKNSSICYPVVGCFDNQSPFDNALLTLPQAPDFVNTQFLLFTQEASSTPQLFLYNDTVQTIRESNLNPERWLRIVVHGFFSNRDSYWIKPMKDELLKLVDNDRSDVLIVDWGDGAKFPHYANAAANTRLVGRQIGIFLQTLQVKGFSFDRIHCIGHSLGAHICGLASNVVHNQLARISGLDPAGPLFEGKDVAVRLDASDGQFVDVIHSNADLKFGVALGSAQPSGHVDFYPNGGEDQPGCPSVLHLIGDVFDGQSKEAYEQSSCAHSRSHAYFIESINSKCPFIGFPCHDYESFIGGQCSNCSASGCARMGFHSADSPGRGNMYLITGDVTPFCDYHYMIEIEFDQTMTKTSGELFVAIYSNQELLVNVSMNSKSSVEFKPGDILRRVFNLKTIPNHFDNVIINFKKTNGIFGLGVSKHNDMILSRVRLQALENSNFGLCQSNIKIITDTSETIMLNRADCGT